MTLATPHAPANTGHSKRSVRANAQDAMLKEALARPGVKEVMEFYGKAWAQYGDYYRLTTAMEKPSRHKASNRSTPN